jgi:hypothetical protein
VQEVTTTGNADFGRSVGTAPIDRITISCDGVTQRAYERYRVNGSYSEALRFMRDSKIEGDPNTYVEWKYIAFEHNDTEAELVEAQRIAEDIGLDSLLFIITNSKQKSKRYTVENLTEFPLVWSGAKVSPAAALVIGTKHEGIVRSEESTLGDRKDASLFVDECRVTESGILWISGWCLTADGNYVDRLDIRFNDVAVSTRTSDIRTDVVHARPYAIGPRCGFLVRTPLGRRNPPQQIVFEARHRNYVETFSATVTWTADAAGAEA